MNDMGPMQAIDNITAVLAVIEEMKKNQIEVNMKKIIIYGQSHGAYLAYLCNRFHPNLFSLIIENSAYIFPSYLDNDRIINYNDVFLVYSYLISKLKDNLTLNLYTLSYLYENFENSCNIICYHGQNDNMTLFNDKYKFANNIKEMIFMGIGEEDLTGDVVKSTNHGLNADFIKLFDISYQAIEEKLQSRAKQSLCEKVEIDISDNKCFVIDYKTGIPICSFDNTFQ